jgi:ketosteroid isomerase-like protein
MGAMTRTVSVSVLLILLAVAQSVSASHAVAQSRPSADGAAASASASAEEKAVLDAIHRACDAFQKGETAFLTEFLHEGFTLTDTRGVVTTREQNLTEVRNREPKYEVFKNHGMTVRVYGDTALVNGITTVKGTSGGNAFAADLQFTDTLIKRNGRWTMVASHVSPLAK